MRALLLLAAGLPLAAQTYQIGTATDGCIGGNLWPSPVLRFGDFVCTFAAPAGPYQVTLSFREPSAFVPASAATGRSFTVTVNDEPKVWQMDLFSAGATTSAAIINRKVQTISTDGRIVVGVSTVKRSGVLSQVAIEPVQQAQAQSFTCGLSMSCPPGPGATVIDVGPAMLTKAAQQMGQDTLCIDTGAVNAPACAPAWPYNGFARGMIVKLIPANTNTGAAALALSGLSPVQIKRADGSALAAGDLIKDRLTPIWFDGSVFRLLASIAAAVAQVQPCQGGNCAGLAKITTASGVYFGVPNPGSTVPNCGNPPGSTPCWLPAQ